MGLYKDPINGQLYIYIYIYIYIYGKQICDKGLIVYIFLEKECKEVLKKRIANEAAVVFTTYNGGRLVALRDQLVRRKNRFLMRAGAETNTDTYLVPPPLTLNTQENGNAGDQEDWVVFEQSPIVVTNGLQQNTGGEGEDEMDQVD